jgi:TRAP-type C4-dicarboxylate transport system substrate-binding protein
MKRWMVRSARTSVEEMAAKGIHGFRTGAFDNGMREITANKRIVTPEDLAGLKMRVSGGPAVATRSRRSAASRSSSTATASTRR